jgi:hypothetical protein
LGHWADAKIHAWLRGSSFHRSAICSTEKEQAGVRKVKRHFRQLRELHQLRELRELREFQAYYEGL